MSTTTAAAAAAAAVPLLSSTRNLPTKSSSRRMFSKDSLHVRMQAIQEANIGKRLEPKTLLSMHLIWNTTMVLISIVVMVRSEDELRKGPLRFWLTGYGIIRSLHSVIASHVYWRRGQVMDVHCGFDPFDWSTSYADDLSLPNDLSTANNINAAKKVETANRIANFIWWVVGACCILTGREMLANDTPNLFKLTLLLLAADMFSLSFFIVGTVYIGVIALLFLPAMLGLLAALLALTILQDNGAVKEVVERLAVTRYIFRIRRLDEDEDEEESEKPSVEVKYLFVGVMTECDTDTPIQRGLSAEVAGCIICLYDYEDGSELKVLQCRHHFHGACIDKWLCIKPNCPLCNYSVPANAAANQRDNEV